MKEDIRLLLDRFYRGVTSIEEEQRLIQYLLSDDCPQELQAECHAVISLARPEAISQSVRLEQRIVEAIQSSSRSRRFWWIGIAASLLVIIGIGFWILLPKESQPQSAQQAQQEVVAKAAKPAVSEPISHSALSQSDEPTIEKSLSSTSQKGKRGQAPLYPADILEIDLASEVADLVANIDQLEQQIIVTETQNNN